ncbi:MAG: hypothetical protein ACFNOP_08305, partial [Bacteroides sp.]
ALPRTLELAALASFMALAVTLPLGILAYRRHGSRVDEAIRIVYSGMAAVSSVEGLLNPIRFSSDVACRVAVFNPLRRDF